jgi:hypothetical protein
MATFAGGQTYDPGSAGNVKMPDVPAFFEAKPQTINYPNWAMFGQTGGAPDPFDMFRIKNQMIAEQQQAYPGLVNMQLGMLPQITAAQMAASQQAFPLQLEQQKQASDAAAAQSAALMQQYAPQYANLLRGEGQKTAEQLQSQMYQFDPEFMANYSQLGKSVVRDARDMTWEPRA